MVFQPNRKITLTNQFIAEKARYTTARREETDYLYSDISLDNHLVLKNTPLLLSNTLKMVYDISSSTTLTGQGKMVRGEKRVNNLFLNTSSSDFITRSNSSYLNAHLNLSSSLPNRSAFTVNNTLVYHTGNQLFRFLPNGKDGLRQDFHLNSFSNKLGARFYKKQRGVMWYVEAGCDYEHEQLENETLKPVKKQTAEMRENLLFARGSAEFVLGKVQLGVKTLVGYWHQHLVLSNGKGKRTNRLKVMPEMSLNATFGRHTFSLTGDYSPDRIAPLSYMECFTDYRNYTFATPIHYDSKNDYRMSALYLFHPSLSTNFLVMYNYLISDNQLVNRLEVTEDMNYSTPLGMQTSNRHFGTLSAGHYVDAIRQSMNLSVNLSSSSFHTGYGDYGLRRIKVLSLYSSLSFRSAFSFPVNYVLGIRYNVSSVGGYGSGTSRSISASFYEDIVVTLGKQWKMKLSVGEYLLGHERKLYLFAKPHIAYTLPRRNLTIDLTAYNIFNNKHIHERFVSEVSSLDSYARIVPAYWLLSVSFRY